MKFGRKRCLKCLDWKKCTTHEMTCSRFSEVIFCRVFFGQVWGNLGKNPSHPQKFAYCFTYAVATNVRRGALCHGPHSDPKNIKIHKQYSAVAWLRGEICSRVQHFGGSKLRSECYAIITRFKMSVDVINYDLQNVKCQRLLPVMALTFYRSGGPSACCEENHFEMRSQEPGK